MSISHRHHHLITTLLFSLVLAGPAGAVVQPPEPAPGQQEAIEVQVIQHEERPGPMGGNPGHGPEGMLMRLRLTPEQQGKFQTMHFEQEKFMVRNRADVAVKRLELQQILGQPDFREQEVRAKYQEIQVLHQQAHQRSLDGFFQIRNLLTAEQRARLPVRWILHHMFKMKP